MMGDWRQTSGQAFKRNPEDSSVNGRQSNHSTPVKALEKGQGRSFAPPRLLNLVALSLDGSIKVTPPISGASRERAVKAGVGVFNPHHACTQPQRVSQSYSTQRAPEVSA